MTLDQRKAKGDETKARILEAAGAIISEEGSKGLSAKKVAERAGVSKSNVFHHFGSVDDIEQALLNGICSMMSEATEGDAIDSLESLFEQMGMRTFSLTKEELTYYKVLFSFYNDTVYDARFFDQLMGLKNDFVTYLIKRVEEIEGLSLSNELAEIITIDIDGMGMHYLIDEDSEKYINLWNIKSKIYIKEIRGC